MLQLLFGSRYANGGKANGCQFSLAACAESATLQLAWARSGPAAAAVWAWVAAANGHRVERDMGLTGTA
eukprot:6722148-Prymnesium_polylepis.1